MNGQTAINRLQDAEPELRSEAQQLVVDYVSHFSDLVRNGETSEIREAARMELDDYYYLISNGGTN